MESIIESNKKTMQRFLQFINSGDKAIANEIISEDVVFYAPTSPEPMHGLKGYMDVLKMMRGAMPDVKWKIEEVIAEGNRVFIRFNMSGTQTEPFMGMPATNRKISVTAMNIYEFNNDGKIIREHGLPDLFTMLGQLGMLPQTK